MDTSQITATLRRIYDEEHHRVIFWYDDAQEFVEAVAALMPPGVGLLRIDELGALAVKIQLEATDPDGRYLVYAPQPQPAPEDDWLLDVSLYSRRFTADSASLWLAELGLTRQALRSHLAARKTFLRRPERLARLKHWLAPDDQAPTLDKKMLAVTLRAPDYETSTLLLRLCAEICRSDHEDFTAPPRLWADVTRFGLADAFWQLMTDAFGYRAAAPKLYDLLLRLFVTDYANNLRGPLPAALQHLCLPDGSKRAWHASVFLANWRANVNHENTYRQLAAHFQAELRVDELLAHTPAAALHEVFTFEAVERRLLSSLRDEVLTPTAPLDPAALQPIAGPRLDGYWTRGEQNPYRQAYYALTAAAEFFALRRHYADGFSFPSAEAMFRAYTAEIYRFDQLYRRFHEAAALVKLEGWNVLHALREAVEDCYGNWFIAHLAATWSEFVSDPIKPLLAAWRIPGVPSQTRFYQREVHSLLETAPQSKVYVVISDAFRYEAAAELTAALNSANRCQAKLSAQLGVLPSYTALGMAALLPHRTLDYQGKDVVADGLSTQGTDNRARILAQVRGTAVQFDEFIKLNKEQGRELVKPLRVIYIYHNRVDATGDAAASESQTFQAVRVAIEELAGLVKHIFNNLNGSQVLITADHGFLYQATAPAPTDRSALEDKPAGAIVAKKRYLIGYGLGPRPNLWHGYLSQTGGIAGDAEFWLPKGANRFHFVAGAKFVHGGAMLQEIAVPVIFAKSLRGQAAAKAQVRKVEVTRLGASTRIVNNVQRFELLQTEAVTERVQTRVLLISLRDAAGQDISNVATVTFDSRSPTLEERKKTVPLILKPGRYDKHQSYFLVLRDAATEVEYLRLPMTIDIAFGNDF